MSSYTTFILKNMQPKLYPSFKEPMLVFLCLPCQKRMRLVSQVNSFQIIWSANPPYLLNTGDCCTWGAKKSPSKWQKRKKNPSDSNQEKGIEHSKIQGFDTVLLWHAAVEHWRGKSAGLLAKRHLNPINIPKPTQPEGIAHSSEITSYNCLQL